MNAFSSGQCDVEKDASKVLQCFNHFNDNRQCCHDLRVPANCIDLCDGTKPINEIGPKSDYLTCKDSMFERVACSDGTPKKG